MRFTGYCDRNNQPINDGDLLQEINRQDIYCVRYQANDEEPVVYLEKFAKKRKKPYIPMSWLNYEYFELYTK